MKEGKSKLYYFIQRLFCEHKNKFIRNVDSKHRSILFICLDCEKIFTKNLDQYRKKIKPCFRDHENKYELRRYNYHDIHTFQSYHCPDCGENITEQVY